jgi:uncharacterized membrane protein
MASTSLERPHNRTAKQSLARNSVIFVAGLVIGIWWLYTPDGILGKADAIGYAVCHRIDLRSFHLGERGLPLCARCSGMYLGAFFTLTYYFVRRPRAGLFPSRKQASLLILFGVLWALDGLNSYLHLFPNAPHIYPPSNTLRVVTGSLIGISLATLIYPVFNQAAWKNWREERVLGSFADLAQLAGLVAVVVMAILTENPLVLYPLALLSSFSVLLILTMVYTTVVLALRRGPHGAQTWQDMLTPLIGGMILAILQIGLIDGVRYWLTGTWSGFRF